MMVTETNHSYVNTLIASYGDSYPQITGRQKKSQEEADQTRSLSSISHDSDKVELTFGGKEKAEEKNPVSANNEAESLSDEEKREVVALKKSDQKVHAHEQAHRAAGGNLITGGPYYKYETGPDGNRYAVSGEVTIDTSEVDGDPKATVIKAGRIRRAALAPADPSAQDRTVAAEAATMAFKAQMELLKQKSAGKNKLQDETPRFNLFA